MADISSSIVAALVAGIWFGVFVATQWLILHWFPSSRRARILVVDYGLCFVGSVITACALTDAPGQRLLSGIFAAMTMGCLFVLYTPFYYVISNSLSVQSITVIRERQGRLAREDLYEKFAGRPLLQNRLETLARSGYVVRNGTAFGLTRRGRRLLAPFLALKSLWKLGPGG
jgi:hypothetical protein